MTNRRMLNWFTILCLCLFVVIVRSAPLIDSLRPNGEDQQVDYRLKNHMLVRRAFLPIANENELGAGKSGDRSKEFGVGNNFVRHLRLLSRMSKRRRPFSNGSDGTRSLFVHNECVNK